MYTGGRCSFSGDTLFKLSVGRTDFPGGSLDELMMSIKEKLYSLPNDTTVYPGHGDITTIGFEKLTTPSVEYKINEFEMTVQMKYIIDGFLCNFNTESCYLGHNIYFLGNIIFYVHIR